MASSRVREILQYRLRDGVDYILVGWKDGTASWTRLSRLGCKALICDFVASCLKALRQKQEIENVSNKKQQEAEMLRKIVDQNAGVNRNTEIAVCKEKIVQDIMQKIRGPKAPGNNHFPFAGIRQPIKPVFRDYPPPPAGRAVPHAQKRTAPVLSKAYKDITRPNVYRMRYMNETICEFTFYYKEAEPAVVADVENMTFAKFEQVSAYLHHLHRKQDGSLGIHCADVAATTPTPQFTDFQRITGKRRLFPMFVSDRTCWILYFISEGDHLLKLNHHNKYVLLRIENDPYFLLFFGLKRIQLQSTAWVDGKYAAGPSFLLDYLFAGQDFPEKDPALFIGDTDTCLGRYVAASMKKAACLVERPCDNCSVVVCDSYFDYIHQIRGLEPLLAKNSRFFGVQDFKIFEILKKGGMFTVTERYIGGCDCVQLFDFVVRLMKKSNWCIKITPAVYRCLKLKVVSLGVGSEDAAVIKKAYNLLKSNCIEAEDADFLHQLEKTFWRDYRYFFAIDDDPSPSRRTVGLEEACRLIGL